MNTPEGKERIVRLEVLVDESRKEMRDGFLRIEKQLDKIQERMDHAEQDIATARVGFKTLLWVGGVLMTVAGTVGAIVSKYLPFLSGAPR